MFYNIGFETLRQSLRATEDLYKISQNNIANANTTGYKKLTGYIANECNEDNQILPTGIKANIIRDTETKGEIKKIGNKSIESSNVDIMQEMRQMVDIANMTRSVLTSIQIDNKLQQDILNILQR